MARPARVGVVTVSDRAAAGEYTDRGGPAVADFLRRHLAEGFELLTRIVPDDAATVETTLRELADDETCSLVITTGGTGPAPRDITPEAVAGVADRILPGFGERMRAVSIAAKPTAILSRQIAATRGSTLIVALPGNPAAIEECLAAVFPAIPHCIDLLGGRPLPVREPAGDPHRQQQVDDLPPPRD